MIDEITNDSIVNNIIITERIYNFSHSLSDIITSNVSSDIPRCITEIYCLNIKQRVVIIYAWVCVNIHVYYYMNRRVDVRMYRRVSCASSSSCV